MKLLVLACLVAAAAARPQGDGLQSSQTAATLADAGILRMESSQAEDGSFQYAFETADQIKQEVSGQLKQIGEEFGIIMQGSYSFVAKDENGNDVPVEVRWVADENGYRAEGDSIPQLGENGAGQRLPQLGENGAGQRLPQLGENGAGQRLPQLGENGAGQRDPNLIAASDDNIVILQ
ncbi:larval cuticle protein 1-like [Amphibalanus amphitrite]|uniref:larval cuticle protein 1-like n=1 Tax=Amphibalanus amphitrite TaxID=1232801 RepID=UPI001C92A8C7|nr:larval cuticle protein 1-like [Amphibalanus amphitrite]